MSEKNIISYIEIDDPTNQTNHAVEVYVTLTDGSKRWCFFHSPETIKNCGDFLKNTNIRIHYGAKHMFVVSELSQSVIRQTLNQLDQAGEIVECTIDIK